MDDDHLHIKEESGYIEPIDASVDWEHLGLPEVPNEMVCFMSSIMLSDISLKLNNETQKAYEEGRRTETAKSQDTQLEWIKQWLEDSHGRPPDLNHSQFVKFAKWVKQFYLDENDKLYRHTLDRKLKAVVEKTHRIYIM